MAKDLLDIIEEKVDEVLSGRFQEEVQRYFLFTTEMEKAKGNFPAGRAFTKTMIYIHWLKEKY